MTNSITFFLPSSPTDQRRIDGEPLVPHEHVILKMEWYSVATQSSSAWGPWRDKREVVTLRFEWCKPQPRIKINDFEYLTMSTQTHMVMITRAMAIITARRTCSHRRLKNAFQTAWTSNVGDYAFFVPLCVRYDISIRLSLLSIFSSAFQDVLDREVSREQRQYIG